jgi:hypothetical protein
MISYGCGPVGLKKGSPTEARYWSIALVYVLTYAIAIYYRMTVSDWLTAHLPF